MLVVHVVQLLQQCSTNSINISIHSNIHCLQETEEGDSEDEGSSNEGSKPDNRDATQQ
jgi:hypothetical protein